VKYLDVLVFLVYYFLWKINLLKIEGGEKMKKSLFLFVCFIFFVVGYVRAADETNAAKGPYLACVATVGIDKTDGKGNISEIKGLASGEIFGFKGSDLDISNTITAEVTEKTAVQIFEIVRDGTISDCLNFFGRPIYELYFTQGQVKEFLDNLEFFKNDGYYYNFLCRENGHCFLVSAKHSENGINMFVFPFPTDTSLSGIILSAKNNLIIVVPAPKL